MEPVIRIKGLLIDMDGLLLDTERLSEKCWKDAEASTGFRMPEGFYYSLIGQSMRCIEKRLHEVMDPACDVSGFMREAGRIYTGALAGGEVPVKEHARDFLEYLEKQAIPRCLATSTGRDLCRIKLERSRLSGYLPLRVCGDEIAHGKPAPDIYLEAASRLGQPSTRLLVLEDSENGLRSALAAGCPTAHVPDIGPVATEIQKQVDRVYRDLGAVVSAFERGEIVLE